MWVLYTKKTRAQRDEVTELRSNSKDLAGAMWTWDINFFLPEHAASLSSDLLSIVENLLCTCTEAYVPAPVGAAGQQSRCQEFPSEYSSSEPSRRRGCNSIIPGAVIIAICIHLFNVLLVSPFYRQKGSGRLNNLSQAIQLECEPSIGQIPTGSDVPDLSLSQKVSRLPSNWGHSAPLKSFRCVSVLCVLLFLLLILFSK